MSGTLVDDCEVLVIGGGLTGLTCAVLLHGAGHSVIVVEAADRPGGRVHSLGPLVEAHDHSGEEGNPAGLFGFIGWPRQVRHINADTLQSAIITQLVRCFGEVARTPDYFHVEDWAENPFICAPTDITEPPQHPQLTPSLLRKPFWDDRVFLAVAEIATVSPGLIEGAFHIGSAVAKGVSVTLR